MNLSFYLILFILLLLAGEVRGSDSCTSQCHTGMLKSDHIHPPAYSCDTCHFQTEKKHPQKNKKTIVLVSEISSLCRTCHENQRSMPYLHYPFKEGMCTECHDPHESRVKGLLKEPSEKLCIGCHSNKQKAKFLHGPSASGDCIFCHEAHQANIKPLLRTPEPDLCLGCHIEINDELKKRSVHPALLGGCSSCHNPHGSDYKKFLINEGDRLCFSCHPVIEEKIKTASSIHKPIKSEKACASCHLPHSSDGTKLMEKSGMNVCLNCHKGFIDEKRYKYLHGPIKNKDCSSCHDSHGSPHRRLLTKEFPEDLYVSYNEKSYELCFTCHNRDLLRYPDTSFATGFRDGNRNLHFLHVNKKQKGRSCRLCHVIHGGTLPKLIAEKVRFGSWEMPVGFLQTDTGGSCAPGCHRKYNYDRKAIEKKR